MNTQIRKPRGPSGGPSIEDSSDLPKGSLDLNGIPEASQTGNVGAFLVPPTRNEKEAEMQEIDDMLLTSRSQSVNKHVKASKPLPE